MKILSLTPTPIPTGRPAAAIAPLTTTPPPPTPANPPAAMVLHCALLDRTRKYALAAYWKGLATPYYSWAKNAWVADKGPDCLLPLEADPLSWCGDIGVFRIPAHLASAAVVIQCVVLDGQGQPLETVDCQVLPP